jgi:hypothetical protein
VSGSAIGAHQDGLDVTDPDTTTPEEIAAYAICFAVLHAGANALDVVDEAAGDLLATQ